TRLGFAGRSGRAAVLRQPRRDRARSARGSGRCAPVDRCAAARSGHADQGKVEGAPVRTALLVWMVPLAGCALLGKSEPVVPRYFTPEYEGSAAAPAPRGDLQLRLGRIEASSHLSER